MIAFLTSSTGSSYKIDGVRYSAQLSGENGFRDRVRQYWRDGVDVLIISASPDDHARNDSICDCFASSLALSGLPAGRVDLCDGRSEALATRAVEYGVIVLTGGHVPTQNAFLARLDLRRRLADFSGLLIAWSAGSMNCAKTVYALPEAPGEALDGSYRRFLPGLAVTRQMILPHFGELRSEMLDGLRVIEDLAFPDSMGREFLALPDGSYLLSDGETETVHGPAWRIRDGKIEEI